MTRRYGMPFASSLLPAPLSAILEFSGLMRGNRSHYSELENLGQTTSGAISSQNGDSERNGDGGAEVSIRIIGVGEQDGSSRSGTGSSNSHSSTRNIAENGASTSQVPLSSLIPTMRLPSSGDGGDRGNMNISPRSPNTAEERGEMADNGGGANGREAGGQRYDFQQLARWIEQALPFTILLLMVFIRQHLHGMISRAFIELCIHSSIQPFKMLLDENVPELPKAALTACLAGSSFSSMLSVDHYFRRFSGQRHSLVTLLIMFVDNAGFFVTFWISAVMIKANDLLRKQTALKVRILSWKVVAWMLHSEKSGLISSKAWQMRPFGSGSGSKHQ